VSETATARGLTPINGPEGQADGAPGRLAPWRRPQDLAVADG